MRAFRLVKPRTFELVELPDPVCGDGQAVVRMREVAVCGSDMVSYLGTLPDQKYPTGPGNPCHECVGEIAESRLDGFTPCDRVMIFPQGGGLAELSLVNSPSRLIKLPADGDLTELLMGQLLGTVMNAMRQLDGMLSDKVAVVGQGPAGMLFNHLAWNLGAGMVIGIDKVPERLAISPKMHATHTLRFGRDDIPKTIKDLTGGEGVDTVIDAAGYEDALDLGVNIVKKRGRILLFGISKQPKITYPIREMMAKRATLVAIAGPDQERDTKQAIRYIAEGRIGVRPILTHRFPFERTPEAYEMFADRKDGCVKVVVEFP